MRKVATALFVVVLVLVGGATQEAAADGARALPVSGTSQFSTTPCSLGPVDWSVGGEQHTGVVCGVPFGIVLHGLPSGIHQFSFEFWDCYVFDGADFSSNCEFDPATGFTCVGSGNCLAVAGAGSAHFTCGSDGFLDGCRTFLSESRVTITGGGGDFAGATGQLHYNADGVGPHQVSGVILI